jgi:aminoglycoside phosphotransferase (APT) family kinase protein
MARGDALGPTTEVRSGHGIDLEALGRYLDEQMPDAGALLEVRQFEGGQSNPTYLLVASGGEFVLRKKPPGTLLPSAHQVDREFRVMRALGPLGVPVPPALALCTDEHVIGTPFFIMGCVRGRVFPQPHLPGVSPPDRRAMYDDMVEVLARLHRIDPVEAGLGDFGKPGNYYARQIDRWSRQYLAAKTDEVPAMDRLMAWLPAHVPPDEETRVVHGDYRVENLIFHPTEPRVVAVVDWELSTLGHPLADLAYNCLTWHLPPEALGRAEPVDGASDGMPDEATYVDTYCRLTGRAEIPHWSFYLAFAMFRLASILQGVYARGLQGNAASAHALQRGAAARETAERGWSMAQR